jgi:hypothetical protein
LLLTIDYPRDQTPNVDGPTQEFIRRVGQYLEWSREQIESFNRTLEQGAGRAIDARRQRVEQRNAQLAKSSIPMRRPGDKAKTYIPDVLVRRPAPSLPETRADDKPPELEPVLDEPVFEHILGIIRMQARQTEQSPGTYAGMGEEDRRQTIVATLNTHYAGRATAEAFNVRAGRTSSSATTGATSSSASASSGRGRRGSLKRSTSYSAIPAGATRSWQSSCSSARRA